MAPLKRGTGLLPHHKVHINNSEAVAAEAEENKSARNQNVCSDRPLARASLATNQNYAKGGAKETDGNKRTTYLYKIYETVGLISGVSSQYMFSCFGPTPDSPGAVSLSKKHENINF
jgi:hypothetical protein